MLFRGMKLTRERKVYVAVLSAAGAIWGIDRVLLSGGPQGAHAGVIEQPAAAIVPTEKAARASGEVPSRERAAASTSAADRTAHPTLASRLETLSRKLNEKDPLSGASGLFEEPAWARPAVVEKAPAADSALDDAEFLASHDLTALLTVEGKPMAIINGKLLKLGESIGGYRLVEIQRDAAHFENGRVSVRLAIRRIGQAASSELRGETSTEPAAAAAEDGPPRGQD